MRVVEFQGEVKSLAKVRSSGWNWGSWCWQMQSLHSGTAQDPWFLLLFFLFVVFPSSAISRNSPIRCGAQGGIFVFNRAEGQAFQIHILYDSLSFVPLEELQKDVFYKKPECTRRSVSSAATQSWTTTEITSDTLTWGKCCGLGSSKT